MFFQKRGFDPAFEVLHEVFAPQPECLGVVASDIPNLLDDQCPLRLGADVADQLRNRRKMATWEDVVVDKAANLLASARVLGNLSTYSSLFEYASYLPSGMVMHWNTAMPPSFFNSLWMHAKYVLRNSLPTASSISMDTILSYGR